MTYEFWLKNKWLTIETFWQVPWVYNNQLNPDFFRAKTIDTFAVIDSSVILGDIFDFQPSFGRVGDVPFPHEVNFVFVLSPLEHRSGMSLNWANNLNIFANFGDNLDFLFCGLWRSWNQQKTKVMILFQWLIWRNVFLVLLRCEAWLPST